MLLLVGFFVVVVVVLIPSTCLRLEVHRCTVLARMLFHKLSVRMSWMAELHVGT